MNEYETEKLRLMSEQNKILEKQYRSNLAKDFDGFGDDGYPMSFTL